MFKPKGIKLSFIIPPRHCTIAPMNSTFIRLWDALEIMDTFDGQGKPVRFTLKFVTANRLEKTGGEIIELKDACKCSVRTISGKEIFAVKKNFLVDDRVTKDTNHWVNSTRNILLPNGQKRKLHIRLIVVVL